MTDGCVCSVSAGASVSPGDKGGRPEVNLFLSKLWMLLSEAGVATECSLQIGNHKYSLTYAADNTWPPRTAESKLVFLLFQ